MQSGCAKFGRNQIIGTVACQGDDTPCVLRPCLLRPWVFLVQLSALENVAVVETLPSIKFFGSQ